MKELPLGNTTSGADWCLKALHPSDPLTEVRGIPDHSAIPSICMNYQTVSTLKPDPTWISDTWGFDMALLPHPVSFAWSRAYEMAGNNYEQFHHVINSQLNATDHASAYNAFKAMAERWRLAYCSVTVYQDGADLANQGTMVVAQVPSEPRTRPVFSKNWVVPDNILLLAPTVEFWNENDEPQFELSQGMPNAYFGRSREGAYVPLKLTDTCQEWRSERDEVMCSRYTGVDPFIPVPLTALQSYESCYPHSGSDDPGSLQSLYLTSNADGWDLHGEATSPMLNGNIAHICAKNLAKTTSYSFFFRYGIEMQVRPGSILAPQMKLSPPYDAVALDAYFSISRELKDAYPADYNDLGKLWEVIKSAARRALPILATAGPYGRLASNVGRAAIVTGDLIQSARKGGSMQKPSAAEVEVMRDIVNTAVASGKKIKQKRLARTQRK